MSTTARWKRACFVAPRWPQIGSCELGRRPAGAQDAGVTLALLWQEYRAAHTGGYAYSQFCERYRQ
jgi:hypothetical protein